MLPVLCSLFVFPNGCLVNNIEKESASDDLVLLRSGSNTAVHKVTACENGKDTGKLNA